MTKDKKDLQERDAERSGTEVRTDETKDKRLGEAGHTYVGRQMDDGLKSNPRIRDEDDVKED